MNKPRGRPSEPGDEFGRGRPKGSRDRPFNAHKALLCAFLNAHNALAVRFPQRAQRIRCALPQPAGVALSFRLPTLRSAEDAERAVEKMTQALHRGQCTPPEATEAMKFLLAHRLSPRAHDVV